MNIVYWIRGAEHAEFAKLSIASVLKVDPHAEVIVYTDTPEETPHIVGTQRRILSPGRPAMVANLDAQAHYMLTAEHYTHVLFLDTDILMREPFPFGTADLYVTWRDHVGFSNGEKVAGITELMPHNYGVVGAIVNPRTIEAFIWLRARILQMGPKYQNWYGNQLALTDLVGRRPESGTWKVNRRIRWSEADDTGTLLSVEQLPCDIYNYSPEAEGEDITAKAILHLKGGRKHLMQHYAGRA